MLHNQSNQLSTAAVSEQQWSWHQLQEVLSHCCLTDFCRRKQIGKLLNALWVDRERNNDGGTYWTHIHAYWDWSWCQYSISNETPLKSYCSLNMVTLRFTLVEIGQVINTMNQQNCETLMPGKKAWNQNCNPFTFSLAFKRTYDTHSIPAIITIAEYPWRWTKNEAIWFIHTEVSRTRKGDLFSAFCPTCDQSQF